MATDLTGDATRPASAIPPELQHGARMDRQRFHRLYEQTPPGFKAELIGGVVYIDGEDGMASPLKASHGRYHGALMAWLGHYWIATPGTDLLDNATVILADDSEPQPDGLLWIEGGNSRIDDGEYLTGSPEFVAEVTDATASIDLGPKLADYERHGVADYLVLVLVLRERQAIWFVRDECGGYGEMAPDSDGLLKSRVFPGLWLDAEAFFRPDGNRVLEVAQAGIASPEYAAFVESLATKR